MKRHSLFPPMRSRCLLLLLSAGTAAGAAMAPSLVPQEILASANGRTLRLSIVVFSPRDYDVRVIDNRAPTGEARFDRLATAARHSGAAAGCNGGFFNRHPFDPVGLMIADGSRVGKFDSSSWQQGLVTVRAGKLSLEVALTFAETPDVTQALQSGPWLVRDAKPEVNGDTRIARRTFICREENGHWAIGVAESCTLGELALALTDSAVTETLAIQDALNFDGGPSSALWVRGEAGDLSLPERWPDRNYVRLFPRVHPLTPFP